MIRFTSTYQNYIFRIVFQSQNCSLIHFSGKLQLQRNSPHLLDRCLCIGANYAKSSEIVRCEKEGCIPQNDLKKTYHLFIYFLICLWVDQVLKLFKSIFENSRQIDKIGPVQKSFYITPGYVQVSLQGKLLTLVQHMGINSKFSNKNDPRFVFFYILLTILCSR